MLKSWIKKNLKTQNYAKIINKNFKPIIYRSGGEHSITIYALNHWCNFLSSYMVKNTNVYEYM